MSKKEKSKKLNKAELENVQGLNQKFMNLKLALGETVLQQSKILTDVKLVQDEFKLVEVELTKSYGENAVINLQTGEVTEPSEEEKKEE